MRKAVTIDEAFGETKQSLGVILQVPYAVLGEITLGKEEEDVYKSNIHGTAPWKLESALLLQ